MKINTKQLTLTALMLAVVFVVTRFIQIPIPLGYFNIGNSFILLFCLLVGNPYGIIAGSLGSALADLTSYPVYTVPTLIIKALMPLVFYLMCTRFKNNKVIVIIAAAVSTLIPLIGYSVTGAFLAHSILEGFAQVPGLALEYAANLIIISALFKPVSKLKKYVQ